jgi:predicted ester cyclase
MDLIGRRLLTLTVGGAIAACAADGGDRRPTESQMTDEPQRNIAILLQSQMAMASGDMDTFRTLVAPTFSNHGRLVGFQGLALLARDLRSTYADFDTRPPLDIIAVGEHVITRLYVSQRHVGKSILPIDGGYLTAAEPTHKRYQIQHIHWWKIRDGKLAEHWANRDDVSEMIQLGLWAAPPGFPGPMQPPAAPPGVVTQGAPTPLQDRNLEVIRVHFAATAARDPERMAAAYTPPQRARVVTAFTDLFTMFSDPQSRTVEIVAAGDWVAARIILAATHGGVGKLPLYNGMLQGVPATGKSFEAQQIHLFRLDDGLIIEHHENRDDVTMLASLGVVAPPPPFTLPPEYATPR